MQGKKVSGGVYSTEAEARSAAIQLYAKLHSTQPHAGLPKAELTSDTKPSGTAAGTAAQQRPCLATSGKKRLRSPDSLESGHCQPQHRVCHAKQALADKLTSSPAQPQHQTYRTLAQQGRHQQQPPTQQQPARQAQPVQTVQPGQGSTAKSTGGLKPRDHFKLPPRLRRSGDQDWMRGYRARWHKGSCSWKFHVRFTYWVCASLADDAASHASATSVILADVDQCTLTCESHLHAAGWYDLWSNPYRLCSGTARSVS